MTRKVSPEPLKPEAAEPTSAQEAHNRHTGELDMTVGSPYRLLIKFAIPLLLGNAFQQLYNTVDSIIVGKFIGKHALAAVGAGFPFMMILVSLFIGFGIATSVIIAQAFGAKDYDRINRAAQTVYKSMLLAAIPISLIGFFSAEAVLRAVNIPDDGTLAMGATYLRIIFAGLFGTIGYNLNAGILQGLGDSKSSVRFLIIAAIINTILDLVFVIPLNMGVSGAAWATIIAQAISWIIGYRYINRHYSFLKLRPSALHLDPLIFREAMRMGVPTAIQNMLFSVGLLVLNALVNSYGSAFIAGFNGANKIDTFLFMPAQSFSNAVTTYVGQNAGARHIERIKSGARACFLLSLSTCAAIGVILYPLSGFAMRLFSNDPQVIEAGVWYLQSVLPAYPFLCILFNYNGVIRGCGKTMVPMIATFVSLLAVRVPAAYFLAGTFGKQYIFYSYGFGWALGALATLIYFYRGSWKHAVLNRIG